MDTKTFLEKANERADFVIAAMGALTAKLRELKPQIEELRKDFRKLKGTQEIAGCKTWKQFCKDKLHRTDSAVRKLLAAGGNEKQKPAGKIPAPTPDELKSVALKAIRRFAQASSDKTAGSLLAEFYPDGESTPPPTTVPTPSQSSAINANGAPQVTPGQPAAKTGALIPAESFHDYALAHFEGKSKEQVLKELGSIWDGLFPNEGPLTLLSDVKFPSKKSPSSVEQPKAQIGEVQ